MGLQPTASKTGLLLQCSRPFSEGIELEEREPGEDALFGTEVHKALERIAKSGEWIGSPEVVDHARQMWACIQEWLGPRKVQPINCERPMMLKIGPKRWDAAPCDFDPETHTYSGGFPSGFLIGATADLVGEGVEGWNWVLDYKTGKSVPATAKTPQLLTLALVWNADEVAVCHMPRGGLPVIYADKVTQAEKKAHARKLYEALSRVGDGFLRMGPECHYCLARESCPTQVGELLVKTGGIVKAVSGLNLGKVDPGVYHQLRGQLRKLLEVADDRIKEEVLAGEVYERPDGKVLEVNHRSRETVSVKTLREAGLEEVARERGAISVVEYDELRAK